METYAVRNMQTNSGHITRDSYFNLNVLCVKKLGNDTILWTWLLVLIYITTEH